MQRVLEEEKKRRKREREAARRKREKEERKRRQEEERRRREEEVSTYENKQTSKPFSVFYRFPVQLQMQQSNLNLKIYRQKECKDRLKRRKLKLKGGDFKRKKVLTYLAVYVFQFTQPLVILCNCKL